jgi:GNAT superfamily N-acetyltransferase
MHQNVGFTRWRHGGPYDSGFLSLLEIARSGDAVWDPECDVVHRAFSGDAGSLDALAMGVFLAIADSKAIGFGLTKMYVGETWILEVYVAMEFRRKGIATRLLEFVVQQHSGPGCGWALLEFVSSRHGSRVLAQRLGFLRAGGVDYPAGGGAPVEYWIRSLESA